MDIVFRVIFTVHYTIVATGLDIHALKNRPSNVIETLRKLIEKSTIINLLTSLRCHKASFKAKTRAEFKRYTVIYFKVTD